MRRLGPTLAGLAIVVAMLVCPPPVLAQHEARSTSPLPISALQYAHNTPSSVARDPAASALEDTVDPPAKHDEPVEHEHWQISL